MQRQCPSGQLCGPCLSHGRHASPSIPAVVDPAASGPNPNSGTVGPNNVTVGVPIADARCCGAESFDTISDACPINEAEARMPSLPAAFAPQPFGSCATMRSPISVSLFPPTTTTFVL